MDTLAQTPAPQSLAITIGPVTLTVDDMSKPTWFGEYYGGKLAIYSVTTEPSTEDECLTVLIVFTDKDNIDCVITAEYALDIPLEDIVDHIQAQAILAYHKQKAEACASTYVPGPDSLQ